MHLFAQMPGGSSAPGKTQLMPASNGHIYGKVMDSTGKAIGDVSVMLLQSRPDAAGKTKEVLLKGTATQSNGDFDFEGVPASGNLVLKISATGYKALEQKVSFAASSKNGTAQKPPAGAGAGAPGGSSMPSFEKDLGKIKLTTDDIQLQGIVVTATSNSTLKLDIDKKVFNVEKNIVSEGGTAVDVMKNVPSVNVDIDGSVSLRNSSPQIMVDGRPTTLTLEQIPANAIESVEVMTNPSSKYDASGGGAGILNIVLKKNKKSGYNGTVRAGVNKYGATDAGADFNVRQNKINVTAGVNIRQANGQSTGTVNRAGTVGIPTAISQYSSETNKGNMLFSRAGLDCFATNKTTLSISGMKMYGNMQPASTPWPALVSIRIKAGWLPSFACCKAAVY